MSLLRTPRLALLLALTSMLVLPAEHVVSPEELQKELQTAAKNREANAARLQKFLSSELARTAVAAVKLNPQKVQKAVAALSDEELARLAAQASRIESDFAAGRLTTTQVTYIILGAILIIVIAIVA
jgi:hypothetical protein